MRGPGPALPAVVITTYPLPGKRVARIARGQGGSASIGHCLCTCKAAENGEGESERA